MLTAVGNSKYFWCIIIIFITIIIIIIIIIIIVTVATTQKVIITMIIVNYIILIYLTCHAIIVVLIFISPELLSLGLLFTSFVGSIIRYHLFLIFVSVYESYFTLFLYSHCFPFLLLFTIFICKYCYILSILGIMCIFASVCC
jgi:hypothetical protein